MDATESENSTCEKAAIAGLFIIAGGQAFAIVILVLFTDLSWWDRGTAAAEGVLVGALLALPLLFRAVWPLSRRYVAAVAGYWVAVGLLAGVWFLLAIGSGVAAFPAGVVAAVGAALPQRLGRRDAPT
jgi:hypothetical protein